jgi:hypothetical protein
METRLINLTPHTVTLFCSGHTPLTLPASDDPARVPLKSTVVGFLKIGTSTVPLVETRLGSGNLPDAAAGVWYVVSEMTCRAHPERSDLVYPDDLVRSSDGRRVLGCRRLARHQQP